MGLPGRKAGCVPVHDTRVVITGMGVISPVGLDGPTLWRTLCAGRSGIRPISLFDTTLLKVRIAGEAHDFDPLTIVSDKEARRCDRMTHFTLGALEAAICVQVLRHGLIPPTINLDDPDPACDLDCVPHRARAAAVDVALSNAFGFGGHNSCLVLRAWRG